MNNLFLNTYKLYDDYKFDIIADNNIHSIFKIYNYYMFSFLYQLVQEQLLIPRWINFSKEKLDGLFSYVGPTEQNPYIKNSDQVEKLIIDILDNGILFPFFLRKKDQNDEVFLGRHRAYVLTKHSVNQDFLGFIINIDVNAQYKSIKTPCLDHRSFFFCQKYKNKGQDLYFSIFNFFDNFPPFIYKYKTIILPNDILQSKNNFYNFINQPWSDYENKYIKLKKTIIKNN